MNPCLLETFLATVSSWRGAYLLVDPDEIFAGFQAPGGNERAIKRVLTAIGRRQPDLEHVAHALEVLSGLDTKDPDRFMGNVLGYTYD